MTCSPHCNRCREDDDPPTFAQRVGWRLVKSCYQALMIVCFSALIWPIAKIPFPQATYINTVACLMVVALMAKLYDTLEAVDE